MNRLKTKAALLAAGLMLASPALAQDPAANATAAAPAPAAATVPASDDGALPKPAAGKGEIVFFRASFAGALLGCTVHEDDKVVSKLPTGKYFVQMADPGVHTYLVESEAKDRLRLEVEAGETYFVKCTISMGIMVGRPNLSPSDAATFEKSAKKLKLQAPPAAS